MCATDARPRARADAPSERLPFTGFRPDIQGLRAVAVGVVLLYHADAPFLSGGFVGVDVFFVISGYLITGLLLREALSTGRIDLAEFYARRARRILPAATIVVIATLVLTVMLLPGIRWQQVGTDAIGAALYVVNWMYAGGTDYLNATVAASPLQHFWTLSVEEQFYIVWPLVLLLLLLVIRGGAARAGGAEAGGDRGPDRARVQRYAGIGVLAILIPSLVWSIVFTASNPAPAYFVTTTRLWELAIGAAIAVFARYAARIPSRIALALGWVGLAGILIASFAYSAEAPAFPGSAALLPTLSATAIIVGGMNGRAENGVGRVLGTRPMRWIGDISYSLYLWHWPLIVVGTYLLGGELRFRWGLLIIALAIGLSWLSFRFVEGPFRDWPWLKHSVRRSLAAGATLMAATVIIAVVVTVAPRFGDQQFEAADATRMGAEALTDDISKGTLATFSDAGAPVDVISGGFTPSAVDARQDNSVIYDNGCQLDVATVTPNGCVFGDPGSDVTVVLAGDSHAANWAPTMIGLAEARGWRLVTHTKSACSLAAVEQGGNSRPYTECNAWNPLVQQEIIELHPDLVVTVNAGRRGVWQDGEPLAGDARLDAFAGGLAETWRSFTSAGIPVAVIADTPDMGIDVPECVSANPDRLTRCAVPRSEAIGTQPKAEPIAVEGLTDVSLIDMNDWICPDAASCPAIVGNVLVWRDNQHLTATYAETLVQPLDAALSGYEL
ncbi:acyltransferase family protein [Leucobacter sp. NPDC077196]|uniref:acyltransferase family protein n=1 Tax=Leucobacter sp. NPDC077196 TaxID=3154959 RepID=UPI00341DC5CF